MRVLRMYIRSHFYLKCDSTIAKCIGGCVYIHTSTYYVKKPQMIFSCREDPCMDRFGKHQVPTRTIKCGFVFLPSDFRLTSKE